MQAGTKLSLTQELGNHVMNAGQPYQSPRQRVWTAIRKHREEFTIKQVAELGQMKYDSTRDFITGLRKAGIIAEVRREQVPNMSKKIEMIYFKLVEDYGYNAPSVDRQGNILGKTATVNKAMWNTLRITKQPVNATELAAISSTDVQQVSIETADSYLRFLHHAGYLRIAREAHHAVRKAKYQLLPGMDTGPIPPQIQRAKQVFDPNTNTVMYSERPELEEEIKHGTLLHDQEEINDEH